MDAGSGVAAQDEGGEAGGVGEEGEGGEVGKDWERTEAGGCPSVLNGEHVGGCGVAVGGEGDGEKGEECEEKEAREHGGRRAGVGDAERFCARNGGGEGVCAMKNWRSARDTVQ